MNTGIFRFLRHVPVSFKTFLLGRTAAITDNAYSQKLRFLAESTDSGKPRT
jgi:hypothetical protein